MSAPSNENPDTALAHARALVLAARRIFVLTGAGISAESGVPTFRGGGRSLVWRGMPFEQLSSARMVRSNLPLVWEWFDYRRGVLGECVPNAGHTALAAAQASDRFDEFHLVTQNIDGLHAAAGSTDVIELHGSIWRTRCTACAEVADLRSLPDEVRPPLCPVCRAAMRPDVVLFGEHLHMSCVAKADRCASLADVCLVVGTSALVYPAAGLPLVTRSHGGVVIEVNPEETELSPHCDVSLRMSAGEALPYVLGSRP